MNIYQLWGLETMDGAQKERVEAVVKRLLASSPAAIIAGQSDDKPFLARLCDLAHAAGAKAYQWTPLFSEYDDRFTYDPIVTAVGGALPRPYDPEFNFRCPNSARNLNAFLEMQDEAMRGVPFDGVFLDRVRYPSFSYGDLSQTACFCDACQALYRARGIDPEALRRALCAPDAGTALAVRGVERGRVLFADEMVQRFFDARCDVVTGAVRAIAAHYASRGQSVALDLFPPELAYLVGQDLPALLPHCAFVKPMIYRYTQAPAGYPYERDAFDRATGQMRALDVFYGDDLLRGQIQAYQTIASGQGKPIFWGIENVYVPGVAEMTPERYRESRRCIAEACGSDFCMSWSVLVMPQENIDAWLA